MYPSINKITYAHADVCVCVLAAEVYCARKLMVYLRSQMCLELPVAEVEMLRVHSIAKSCGEICMATSRKNFFLHGNSTAAWNSEVWAETAWRTRQYKSRPNKIIDAAWVGPANTNMYAWARPAN
jgi:hypothetical protein